MTNTQRLMICVDKLRELVSQGKNDREIADILGCSPQVIGERRRENGIPSSLGMHGRKQVDVARVAELASQGMSDRAIGLELGHSENLIRARRLEAGIEPGNPKKRNKYQRPATVKEDPIHVHTNVLLADAAFAKLIGNQKFTDVRLKQPSGPIGKPLRPSVEISYTGNAAAMCVA